MPSTCSPNESRSLPAPSPKSLNGWAHGFQMPISASRLQLVDNAVLVLGELGGDDVHRLIDREQSGADGAAMRPASAAVNGAMFASAIDSLAILAMRSVAS